MQWRYSSYDRCHLHSCTAFHTDRTGANFTYQLCNLSFSLSSGLEERNDQLYPLSSSRTCGTSCIFRIHRRNRKACGPTGGYIIGFIPMAIIAGIVIDKFSQRWIQILGMIVGTAICYAFGTAWFCIQAGYTVSAALAVCVIPFIPADLIKMVFAMIIGPEIRKKTRSCCTVRCTASARIFEVWQNNNLAPSTKSGKPVCCSVSGLLCFFNPTFTRANASHAITFLSMQPHKTK